MNDALIIIEKRSMYTHLILFRLFIEILGRTDKVARINHKLLLQGLLKEEFDKEMFDAARQYLNSENLVRSYDCLTLSVQGRAYIEDWLRYINKLCESDKRLISSKIPKKVTNFLGIMSNTITVSEQVSELLEKFK